MTATSVDGPRGSDPTRDAHGVTPVVLRAVRLAAARLTGAHLGSVALEITALTAFVVARPVLASFGGSPETFIARGADWTDVVAFGLLVVLVPPVVVMAVEVLASLGGARSQQVVHLAALGVLAGLGGYQVVGDGLGASRALAAVAGAVVGGVFVVLRMRLAWWSTFLRYASLGAVVFLAQFLAMSPAASIALGGRHALPTGPAEAAAAAVGDDAAPVVMVVMDGLPTAALLDGTGHIDAELYPNFARLAGDATWYRNNTTVAQVTLEAVPAILSGQRPDGDSPAPVASHYENNVFSLLSETHEVHGREMITGVCPVQLCPEPPGWPVGELLGDASRVWGWQMEHAEVDPELVPDAFDERSERIGEAFAAEDFTPGDRPGLYAYHMLLPHPRWEYLPDGGTYADGGRPPGLFLGAWSLWGADVGRQRHVLQTQDADRLLGELLDRLEESGVYDDALVVVTADHGYAFVEDSPWRGLSEDNYDEVMWTPLLVKSPGQTAGAVDDSNVTTLDIVPTVADELGVELSWEADGAPAGSVARDPGDKWVLDWEYGVLRADDGEDVVHVDGRAGFDEVLAADWVEGSGPLAVWQRTEHGALVGRSLDELEVDEGEVEGEVEVDEGEVEGEVEEGGADERDGSGERAEDAPPSEGLAVTDLWRWRDVDADDPLLEIDGQGAGLTGTAVAIAVDGRVAAVAPRIPTEYGVDLVHALLWPDALHDGDNEITAYDVTGPPEAPELRRIPVTDRPRG